MPTGEPDTVALASDSPRASTKLNAYVCAGSSKYTEELPGDSAPTVSAPTLSILIATLGQRRDLFGRLMFGLMPQVEAAGGRVKVLAYWDNGEADLAAKRQALVEACETDYLCFVDDDDTVTDDYVASVLGALETRPDFVGLWMNVHKDGAITDLQVVGPCPID